MDFRKDLCEEVDVRWFFDKTVDKNLQNRDSKVILAFERDYAHLRNCNVCLNALGAILEEYSLGNSQANFDKFNENICYLEEKINVKI